MSNYIGVRCPVCNKKFVQADDIVVCPVCGAPHHRVCYAEKRECAFATDHIDGREWRAPAPEPTHEAESGEANPDMVNTGAVMCASCKSPNPKGAFFCQICGRPLQYGAVGQNQNQSGGEWGFPGFGGFGAGADQSSFMYGGLSPDEVIDDVPARDLALYIGENSAYYLANFKNMDETSRTLSFNFSSLIFGFFYFFYRKMNFIGGALLALYVVCSIPAVLHLREYWPQVLYLYGLGSNQPVDLALVEHYRWLSNVAATINLFIGAAVSFCSNRFYFAKVIRDVKKIRAQRSDLPDERIYAEALSNKGGVSKAVVIAVACAIMAASFICAGVFVNPYMTGIA